MLYSTQLKLKLKLELSFAKKKIMMEIVITNIVTSWPSERQPLRPIELKTTTQKVFFCGYSESDMQNEFFLSRNQIMAEKMSGKSFFEWIIKSQYQYNIGIF